VWENTVQYLQVLLAGVTFMPVDVSCLCSSCIQLRLLFALAFLSLSSGLMSCDSEQLKSYLTVHKEVQTQVQRRLTVISLFWMGRIPQTSWIHRYLPFTYLHMICASYPLSHKLQYLC